MKKAFRSQFLIGKVELDSLNISKGYFVDLKTMSQFLIGKVERWRRLSRPLGRLQLVSIPYR